MYGASNIDKDGAAEAASQAIYDMWYKGEVNLFPSSAYGRPNPDMGGFHDWGHFTQVVWKSTTKIGCYSKLCPAGTIVGGMSSWYTVCNYHPAGMSCPSPFDPALADPSLQATLAANTATTSRPPHKPASGQANTPDKLPPEWSRRAAPLPGGTKSCVMHLKSSDPRREAGSRQEACGLEKKISSHRERRRSPCLFPIRFLYCMTLYNSNLLPKAS